MSLVRSRGSAAGRVARQRPEGIESHQEGVVEFVEFVELRRRP